MEILITGINGFAGINLYNLLKTKDVHISGIIGSSEINDSIKDCELYCADITDYNDLRKVIEIKRPDIIFHLAAQSSAGLSWENPQRTVEVNVNGTLNLLMAVKELKLSSRVVLIGSSEEYGSIDPSNIPVSEDAVITPGNPYAVSKATQTMFGMLYHRAFDMDIVMARAFNHIGPRQSPNFVISDFARRIVMMEKGMLPPVLKVGNLEAARDFSDVRDIVDAYWQLSQKGKAGEVYNVGSGKAYKIKDLLRMLIDRAKIDISIEIDKSRFRPLDVPIICADISKIRSHIGWEPKINIETSLDDILDYWRNEIND